MNQKVIRISHLVGLAKLSHPRPFVFQEALFSSPLHLHYQVPAICITDGSSCNAMQSLFSRRAQRELPMAGRLDLKNHSDSDEDLGISSGYSKRPPIGVLP